MKKKQLTEKEFISLCDAFKYFELYANALEKFNKIGGIENAIQTCKLGIDACNKIKPLSSLKNQAKEIYAESFVVFEMDDTMQDYFKSELDRLIKKQEKAQVSS